MCKDAPLSTYLRGSFSDAKRRWTFSLKKNHSNCKFLSEQDGFTVQGRITPCPVFLQIILFGCDKQLFSSSVMLSGANKGRNWTDLKPKMLWGKSLSCRRTIEKNYIKTSYLWRAGWRAGETSITTAPCQCHDSLWMISLFLSWRLTT